MKQFTLLLMSLLMVSSLAFAQKKLCVHKLDGTRIEVLASEVSYIDFEDVATEPDDTEDDEPVVPETSGFVEKPFSVSAIKTVTFSSGNLQYHAANNEWRFAPNQTDHIGEENSNISPTYNGWIDLFGWGTGNNPTNISSEGETNFVDWGVNKIGNFAPNTWRTLTSDEWEYIIKGRPNAEQLIGIAKVNGVNGLILLPDNWTCPSGGTFKPGFDDDYCIECYGNYQTFSSSDWAKLEASGAVFLPTVGSRYGFDVDYVQNFAYYWSTTARGENDAFLLFFCSEVAEMEDYNRGDGQSVRLVKDNNKTDDSADSLGIAEGHEYVDLGLPSGTLWATCNVGANAPEDYGDYFAWGEITTKTTFDWSTYKWYNGGSHSLTKYCTNSDYGTVDNKTVLDLADDAAYANWGGEWRMPTSTELDELRTECTWTWNVKNGINGCIVTGPNGNTIFLPAAGVLDGSNWLEVGTIGGYWSSLLGTYYSDDAYGVGFNSNEVDCTNVSYRGSGLPIRPVLHLE